jgi:hypothetical protein
MNYIKFSKFWSKNMSNILVKYLCCNPSSKVVSLFQVLTYFLCDFRSYSLAWIYQHRRENQPRSGAGERLLWTLLQGLNQFRTHFCPFCMLNHFQSLDTVGKLTHHHWKFLFGPDEGPKIFSCKKTTTCWNIDSCKKKYFVGKYWLSKKFINNFFYHIQIPFSLIAPLFFLTRHPRCVLHEHI